MPPACPFLGIALLCSTISTPRPDCHRVCCITEAACMTHWLKQARKTKGSQRLRSREDQTPCVSVSVCVYVPASLPAYLLSSVCLNVQVWYGNGEGGWWWFILWLHSLLRLLADELRNAVVHTSERVSERLRPRPRPPPPPPPALVPVLYSRRGNTHSLTHSLGLGEATVHRQLALHSADCLAATNTHLHRLMSASAAPAEAPQSELHCASPFTCCDHNLALFLTSCLCCPLFFQNRALVLPCAFGSWSLPVLHNFSLHFSPIISCCAN